VCVETCRIGHRCINFESRFFRRLSFQTDSFPGAAYHIRGHLQFHAGDEVYEFLTTLEVDIQTDSFGICQDPRVFQRSVKGFPENRPLSTGATID